MHGFRTVTVKGPVGIRVFDFAGWRRRGVSFLLLHTGPLARKKIEAIGHEACRAMKLADIVMIHWSVGRDGAWRQILNGHGPDSRNLKRLFLRVG